jgi:hypothetical protein
MHMFTIDLNTVISIYISKKTGSKTKKVDKPSKQSGKQSG